MTRVKKVRIELRLNPGVAAEKAIIDALGADPAYGEHCRAIKEWLRRGLEEVNKELDRLLEHPDPLEALDAGAGALSQQHYTGMRALLVARLGQSRAAVRTPQPAPVAAPAPETPAPPVATPAPRSKGNWAQFRGLAGLDSNS